MRNFFLVSSDCIYNRLLTRQITLMYKLNILKESSWSHGEWIYNYLYNQCLSPLMLWVRIQLRRGVLETTLCDQVCQWLAAGRWFSPGTPVSSTNKTDRHDITEICFESGVKHHKPKPEYFKCVDGCVLMH